MKKYWESSLNTDAIETCTNIKQCTTTEGIRYATIEDDDIGAL